MTVGQVHQQLQTAFATYLGVPPATTQTLVPQTTTSGKLYEAFVLSLVLEKLVIEEGYSLVLVGGTQIKFKGAPGPINRSYPRIELRKVGACVAEIWTDVEFLAFSFWTQGTAPPTLGEYHELDLLVVEPGLTGRPTPDQIWLGVECKNTGYKKGLLKEILGVRRELGLLASPTATKFATWPRPFVPAQPPSCLLVYATDQAVLNYSAPGQVFGIDFECQQM